MAPFAIDVSFSFTPHGPAERVNRLLSGNSVRLPTSGTPHGSSKTVSKLHVLSGGHANPIGPMEPYLVHENGVADSG